MASHQTVRELAAPFDSVAVCYSKGLGAPVGSLLAGSKDFIRAARRARKLFGGGMRQIGVLAAAALYALDHNIAKLAQDHIHAQMLASAIADNKLLAVTSSRINTNMVIFSVNPAKGTAAEFVDLLHQKGIGALPFGPQLVRLVTHFDVSTAQIQRACEVLKAL